MSKCLECVRLRRKHAEAALTHTELRDKLREAVRDGRGELVTALIVSEAAALKERDVAETAVRRHESLVHEKHKAEGASA